MTATVAPNLLTYTETALITTGQTYFYQVTATNAIGEGALSGGIYAMAAQVPNALSVPKKVAASPIFV